MLLVACDDRAVKEQAAATAARGSEAMAAAVDEGASVREIEKLGLKQVILERDLPCRESTTTMVVKGVDPHRAEPGRDSRVGRFVRGSVLGSM